MAKLVGRYNMAMELSIRIEKTIEMLGLIDKTISLEVALYGVYNSCEEAYAIITEKTERRSCSLPKPPVSESSPSIERQ